MTEIGEKVAHVRAARRSRGHKCHWPGCEKEVPPAMWGCKPHWYALPASIRRRIWATYKIGQEETLSPSSAYLAAAKEARDWIAKNGNAP